MRVKVKVNVRDEKNGDTRGRSNVWRSIFSSFFQVLSVPPNPMFAGLIVGDRGVVTLPGNAVSALADALNKATSVRVKNISADF